MNLLWDVSEKEILCGYGGCSSDTKWHLKDSFTFKEWQDMGYDMFSITADPLFKDIEKMDFTLSEDSPAFNIGFETIDTRDVGPRVKNERYV